MSRTRSVLKKLLLAMALLFVIALVALLWLGYADRDLGPASTRGDWNDAALIERGRQLVQLGDCRACHTAQGGESYAGGRAIPTAFGNFYSPNLTPDKATGLGDWSADEFWRALHLGKSRDGQLLYPAFPYTNYSKVTREDADAMYAFLRSLPPISAPARKHELSFPYQYRALLVGWRALFFRPGVYREDATQSAEWNRGAYLVQGLGHCSACHEARNALGAIQSRDNPAGGLVLNWYAPVLSNSSEAGLADWPVTEIAALLKTGVSKRGSVSGPMAEVVYESLQHASDEDVQAMALYLKALPQTGEPEAPKVAALNARDARILGEQGAGVYQQHCAQCHGDTGEGRAPAAPALAGNRAVTLASPVNPIRMVIFGGYAPGTAGNPRPYGMPPFGHRLSNDEIAAVLTYLRGAWGNQASAVSPVEVARHQDGPLW